MNKYKDARLIRTNFVRTCLSNEELALIRDYQQQTRAPTLSAALRNAALAEAKHSQRMVKIWSEFKETKESNKENKEIPIPSGNAPARPKDFDFYFYQITDDESLRGMVEEFLNGERRKGVDLARKTDLREHFWNWLPKFKAKQKANAKWVGQLQEQNQVKQAREAQAAEQQRQINEQINAANTPEAQAARAQVLAKFGKPWRKRN